MRALILLILFLAPINDRPSIGEKIWRGAVYLSVGSIFHASSTVAYAASYIVPAKECLFFSRLCSQVAMHAYGAIFKDSKISYLDSFDSNRQALLQIPAMSVEDLQLLRFLQERWLAKVSGYSSLALNWIYPCFGLAVQSNVNTSHCYSRLPAHSLSKSYESRMNAWKQSLPHPEWYPLILTRPVDIREYLPSWLGDQISIERIDQGSIGGIRIIPKEGQSQEEIEGHYRSLLDWISCLGLAANRIEIDRWPVDEVQKKGEHPSCAIPSREEFLSRLGGSHENAMVEGAVRVLKGLLTDVSEQKWNEMIDSPTHSSIIELCFSRIIEELKQIKKDQSIFDAACHLEQVFANLSSLLEIFKPFDADHFSTIYQDLLSSPSLNCGIHTSGMTCLAGILKAAEKTALVPPRVLYGENTYFECVRAIEKVASLSVRADRASEEDYKNADLLVAQFNPGLRTEYELTCYKSEKIGELLRKCLKDREKPLTVALDGTLDRIDSPRALQLIEEFQNEIERGILNVICYRSGHKYDLFGMDNYCGAPFFMAHNTDPKWDYFRSMIVDPVLQCDPLSLNWFCLAYRYAPMQLKKYQELIFENTKALLDRIPKRLLQDQTLTYRIIPFESEIDPSFIDIKVSGPLHAFKIAAFVGGTLILKALEGGQPLFTRPSLGFYHPNYTIIFGQNHSTLRLTLGPDPAQVELFAECFQLIDELNGS